MPFFIKGMFYCEKWVLISKAMTIKNDRGYGQKMTEVMAQKKPKALASMNTRTLTKKVTRSPKVKDTIINGGLR